LVQDNLRNLLRRLAKKQSTFLFCKMSMRRSKLVLLQISTMACGVLGVITEADKVMRHEENPEQDFVIAEISSQGQIELGSNVYSRDVHPRARSKVQGDESPWCWNLLETYNVWGKYATGIDVGAYTGETLKWIGCVRDNGCNPYYFRCKDTVTGIEFGTGDDEPLRVAFSENGKLHQDHDEVCSSPEKRYGVYDAFIKDRDAKELCKKMKFKDGKVKRKSTTPKGNSCPQVNWNGTNWTSDFKQKSDGHATWIECSLKEIRPKCSDLIVKDTQIWGGNATGVNVSKYANDSDLHWIGCSGGVGCEPESFSCNDTDTGIQFGTTSRKSVRALLGKNIPKTWGGCCTANSPNGACNNMGRQEDADQLCKQMGFGGGRVQVQHINDCPEVEYKNGAWTSTFARAEGYGKTIACTWAIPTPAPTPAPTEPGGCNFEKDYCGWQVGTGFRWERKEGPTNSLKTGPEHAKSGKWYVYTDASGFKKGDFADLTIETDRTQLSFYYHMYGEAIGKLEVISGGNSVWSKEGDQHDMWQFESNIRIGDGIKNVTVRATRGDGQTNDFAIDNLRLYGTPAPTPEQAQALPTTATTPTPTGAASTIHKRTTAQGETYRAAAMSMPILSLLFMACQ